MKSLRALYELQAGFSGSMIAIQVPPEPWYKLRSSIREPLDTPHVTVAYMPDLQKEEIPQVRAAVAKAVEDHEPFKIKVDKISTFEQAKNSEGKLPHIALLEKKDVTKLRDSIVKELQKIRPDIVSTKFKVYKPHATLQWVTEDVPFPILEDEVSWEVKDVRLYFKNAPREKFPLALKKIPNLQEELVQEVVAFVNAGDITSAIQVLAQKK